MSFTSLPRPVLFGAIGVAVVLASVAGWMLLGRSGTSAAAESYFTSDGGKTFFRASAENLPPFFHDGKEALGARIFADAKGQPFVGYLERYTDAGKARAKELLAERAAGKGNPGADATLLANMEIRKPAGGEWIKAGDAKALEVRRVMCPDRPAQPAMPYTPDERR